MPECPVDLESHNDQSKPLPVKREVAVGAESFIQKREMPVATTVSSVSISASGKHTRLAESEDGDALPKAKVETPSLVEKSDKKATSKAKSQSHKAKNEKEARTKQKEAASDSKEAGTAKKEQKSGKINSEVSVGGKTGDVFNERVKVEAAKLAAGD